MIQKGRFDMFATLSPFFKNIIFKGIHKTGTFDEPKCLISANIYEISLECIILCTVVISSGDNHPSIF